MSGAEDHSAPVVVLVEGAVATIKLNRPEAGNTINLPLARALLEAAVRCDSDPAVRCVVLTGTGKLFCGGGDLASFPQAADALPEFLSELAGTLHLAVGRLMRMRKPLLVLVNGPAAGAGFGLAIAGDIVLASEAAHFTAAHLAVGLSPDGGLSWLLPRLVGMRKAQEMIITNRRVSAMEAATIGLVTRTVPNGDLVGEGAQQAALLAASATGAIGAARALLLASFETTLEEHLERETRSIAALGSTPDCREGAAAFLARRKPDFQGVA